MTGRRLILLTGAVKIVENILTSSDGAPSSIPYFPSKYRELRMLLDIESDLFEELLKHESKRDDEIENILNQSNLPVLVEEWHLGNTAWAKAWQIPMSDKYEIALQRSVEVFDAKNIVVWYISTDPDKWDFGIQGPYNSYINELSSLLSRFNFKCETIDGEDLLSSIEKRIVFLLNDFKHIL